ncbi:MAG: cation:proton antiporter [Flavobacteriaceae bacterium]|nr:cation:proton antiporter [Flavobacteriaceae bacterium]
MNTLTILFVFPILIIFSYLFDALARRTKFPAVILLMVTGMIIRAIAAAYSSDLVGVLDNLIPVLGTIGLILIVLEGALELEITKEKLPLIIKGFVAAAVLLVTNIVGLTFVFQKILDLQFNSAIIYSIPLSIISSAVAIPSAGGLLPNDKEFVVYESTFSDILGIMIFNYALRQFESDQSLLGGQSMISLAFQIIGVILISLVITYVLFRLLQNIAYHVKFFLILALLVLVYAFGKLLHLPALVTIFIFGLFMSNVKSLLPPFLIKYLNLEESEKGLHEFHILTAESTFLVRTFFFLFFGFSISLSQFNSLEPFLYGALIFFIMLFLRHLYFMIGSFKLNTAPLLYMAPRGLISILLFLQIDEISFPFVRSEWIDERTLLVVILLSMVVLILGNNTTKKAEPLKLDQDELLSPTVEFPLKDSQESNETTNE